MVYVGGFAHVCMSVGREAGRKRKGVFIKLRDNCTYKMHRNTLVRSVWATEKTLRGKEDCKFTGVKHIIITTLHMHN